MEEDKEYSLNNLHKRSYRLVQKIAKLLNLPSNLKKAHLIILIHAKMCKSVQELELLIKELKLERLHKRRPNNPSNALQNNEIPISENANQSPQISQSPANLLKEELKSQVNLNSGREAIDTINKNKNFTSVIERRRQYARAVAELRAQHKQSLLNKPTVSKRCRKLSGITSSKEATKQLENRVNSKYVHHNLTIRSSNGTYNTIKVLVPNPALKPCSHDKATRPRLPELIPLTSMGSVNKNSNQNCKIAERYPNLSSGVNNDKYVHISKVNNKCETIVNNLRFNNENGNSDNLPKGTVSLLRVNATIANVTDGHINNNIMQYNDRASRNIGPRKDNLINNTNNEFNIDSNIIPIAKGDPGTNGNVSINSDCASNREDIPNINNFPRDYSNMQMDHEYARKYGVTPSNNVCTPINGGMINSIFKINETSHDYILNNEYPTNVNYYPLDNGYSRNENTRNSAYSSRNYECLRNDRTTEGLPRISPFFSKFNKVNYYNPLHMNINENNPPPIPHFAPIPQNKTIYNYKKQCIIDDPIVYPVTVSALTESMYSRPVMTACLQASAYEQSDNLRPPQHSQNTTNVEDIEASPDELVPESCDAIPISEMPAEFYEVTDNTTPDMVEDATEIIFSQDGGYLGPCGIDVMKCILCSWAGAKITLEHHIRRTHSAAISTHALNTCNVSSVTYCLCSVPRAPLVRCRVLDLRGALLALSVSTYSPTGFRASLAMIAHETEAKVASITVINKLTGEPHRWHGIVQQFTENFPFDIESCLDIDLRETNHIPSNCNLDDINKQSEITSPSQVFSGTPDPVTDISITLLIKIH